MPAKVGRWLCITVSLLALLLVGAIGWRQVRTDLNQPARRAAWEQLQRNGNTSFVTWDKEKRGERDSLTPRFDPRAAMLWLAAGFDPNGNVCAERGKPPDAFANAIWRPFGFCEPRNADQIPFILVVAHGHTQEARDVARLMIAAGADVNRASPDGILPLPSAVMARDEEMVKLLLDAGADPLLKPKYSQIGDLSSALEKIEILPKDASTDRIRQMLRAAAERRSSSGGR